MTLMESGMRGALGGLGIVILLSVGRVVYGICSIAYTYFKKNASQVRKIFSLLNPTNNELYEQALAEIDNNQTHKGLWARCLSEAEGDKDKSTARYIKYRVKQLQQEALGEKATVPQVSQSVIRKPINKVKHKSLWPWALAAIVYVGVLVFINNKPTASTPVAVEAPVAPVAEAAPAAAVPEAPGAISVSISKDEALTLVGFHPGVLAALHDMWFGRRIKEATGSGYHNFLGNLDVATNVEQVGDFIIGHGCRMHDCPGNESGFIIDLNNEKLVTFLIESRKIEWINGGENGRIPVDVCATFVNYPYTEIFKLGC